MSENPEAPPIVIESTNLPSTLGKGEKLSTPLGEKPSITIRNDRQADTGIEPSALDTQGNQAMVVVSIGDYLHSFFQANLTVVEAGGNKSVQIPDAAIPESIPTGDKELKVRVGNIAPTRNPNATDSNLRDVPRFVIDQENSTIIDSTSETVSVVEQTSESSKPLFNRKNLAIGAGVGLLAAGAVFITKRKTDISLPGTSQTQ